MTNHIHDISQVVGRPAGYVNDATGTQHVVYRGDADFNVINEVRWDGTGLHYTNLNLAAGGTPAGVATGSGDPAAYVFRAQGTEHVVYRGFDNHVHELRKDASGWHHGDLTTMTGAPAAAGDPAGYVFEAQGTQHVMYRSGDGHVHELWWDATAGWHRSDLTAVTGAPAAAGDPAGYAFEAQGTQHVMYRAANGHVHELWWDATNGWGSGDLTAITGAPTAAGDPAAYVFDAQGTQTQHVMYRSGNGHVHELWWDATNGWGGGDLTAVTGAPAAAGDPAAYVFDAEGSQHVIYRAGNGHLYELWWTAALGWNQGDLTAAAGSPPAAGDPGAYEFRAEGTQHVIYRTADGHLHEMWWRPGPGNHDGDLTIAARPPKPNAPADLTLTKQADRMVTVSWVDRSANEDGFEIRFHGTRDGFTDHGGSREVERNVTTADLAGLRSGYDYRITVIAFNAGGDSASSNEVQAALPHRLINVTTEGTGASTVWTVTGSAFTPFGLAVIRFTNPAFQQVQFSQSAGADGKFVSRHSIANVASGERITITAFEDADPEGTSANAIVTTCP